METVEVAFDRPATTARRPATWLVIARIQPRPATCAENLAIFPATATSKTTAVEVVAAAVADPTNRATDAASRAIFPVIALKAIPVT